MFSPKSGPKATPPRQTSPGGNDDIANLARGLAVAGQRAEMEAASICSQHSSRSGSEARDHMDLAKRTAQELERQSRSGSGSNVGSETSSSRLRATKGGTEDGMSDQAATTLMASRATSATTRSRFESERSGATSAMSGDVSASSGSNATGSISGSGTRSSHSGINVLNPKNLPLIVEKVLNEVSEVEPVQVAEVVAQVLVEPAKEEIQELKLQLEEVQQNADAVAKEAALKAEVVQQLEAVKDKKVSELAAQKHKVAELAELAIEEKEDMQDQVKGQEAAQELKLRMLEEELERERRKKEEKKQQKEQVVQEVKSEKIEEVKKLKEVVKDKKWHLEMAKAERDALRRDKVIAEKIRLKEVSDLQEMIRTAKKTLEGEVWVTTAIKKTEEQNEALQENLIQLKRQVENIEEKKEIEVRNLEKKVELKKMEKVIVEQKPKAAKKILRQKSSKVVRGAMPSINEEDDDNMSVSSCGHSGQVSDGEEGIGCMEDFGDEDDDEEWRLQRERSRQEKVNELYSEIYEQRRKHNEFKDEVVARRAKVESKKARLVDQVDYLKHGDHEDLNDLREKREHLESRIERKEAEVREQMQREEALAAELQLMQREKARMDQKASQRRLAFQQEKEAISNKLYHAQEMSRVSGMRMEDTKREMQRRHEISIAGYERVLSTLLERMRSRDPDAEGAELAQAPEEKDEDEIQNEATISLLREERNDILHQLERKESYWQAKLEEMDSKVSQDMADIRKDHKQRTQSLQTEHADEKQELLEKKESIQHTVKLNRAMKADFKEKAQNMPEAPDMPAWLAWMRGGSTMPRGLAEPTNCHVTVWQTLSAIPDVNALMCNLKDFAICHASKKAYKVWGSAALHGHSLLSLLHRPEEAAWLKRAIGSHQVLADLEKVVAPGFLVRDLGTLALRGRANNAFDAVVTTAHIPQEVKTGRPKMIVAIINPIAEDRQGLNIGADMGRLASNKSVSNRSDVSDDVSPSDSVSHVADRRYT